MKPPTTTPLRSCAASIRAPDKATPNRRRNTSNPKSSSAKKTASATSKPAKTSARTHHQPGLRQNRRNCQRRGQDPAASPTARSALVSDRHRQTRRHHPPRRPHHRRPATRLSSKKAKRRCGALSRQKVAEMLEIARKYRQPRGRMANTSCANAASTSCATSSRHNSKTAKATTNPSSPSKR